MKAKVELTPIKMKPIDEFLTTVATLRGPNGCPWDKEQTHESLKRYLIEEVYETIEAIESKDPKSLMEELGDLLLQIALHAQIASESKDFTFDDIAKNINSKMQVRHPHVFSDTKVKNKEEVIVNWEKIKKEEKPHRKEIFDGIPISLPALLKGLKVSKKVAREGFDWKENQSILKAFESEMEELKTAIILSKQDDIEDELGDSLFMIVNIARWFKLDPEELLNKSIKKFITRYKKVKEFIESSNKNTKDMTEFELNDLWEKAKKKEKI